MGWVQISVFTCVLNKYQKQVSCFRLYLSLQPQHRPLITKHVFGRQRHPTAAPARRFQSAQPPGSRAHTTTVAPCSGTRTPTAAPCSGTLQQHLAAVQGHFDTPCNSTLQRHQHPSSKTHTYYSLIFEVKTPFYNIATTHPSTKVTPQL